MPSPLHVQVYSAVLRADLIDRALADEAVASEGVVLWHGGKLTDADHLLLTGVLAALAEARSSEQADHQSEEAPSFGPLVREVSLRGPVGDTRRAIDTSFAEGGLGQGPAALARHRWLTSRPTPSVFGTSKFLPPTTT